MVRGDLHRLILLSSDPIRELHVLALLAGEELRLLVQVEALDGVVETALELGGVGDTGNTATVGIVSNEVSIIGLVVNNSFSRFYRNIIDTRTIETYRLTNSRKVSKSYSCRCCNVDRSCRMVSLEKLVSIPKHFWSLHFYLHPRQIY
uniref:Uncharacterized protein n=1 Tax=Cacopsylla melanoneura TaxID=428564 RepID=A0A8D9B9J2_9HEMI